MARTRGDSPPDSTSGSIQPSKRSRQQANLRLLLRTTDVIVGTSMSLAAFIVHPTQHMLSAAYWYDEQWVALSTRVSLAKLPLVTCVSPIGFTFLLRMVPGVGQERYRLIVLVFVAGTVTVAYLLGRELRLMPVAPGMVVAGGVLLAPMFARVMSLKPYAVDAFVTLVMFLLLARLESEWSRGRLAAIATGGVVATLFSHTAVFVTAAVLGSLVIETTMRREWRKAIEVLAAGAVSMVGIAIVFLVFVQRHQNDSLRAFWTDFFLPTNAGLSGAQHWLAPRVDLVLPLLGTRHVLAAIVMVVVGFVTLLWINRVALAIAAPLLVIIAMVASAMRKYPFLERRTSMFWLIAILVLMAIGAAGIVAWLARVHFALGIIALVAFAIVGIHQAQALGGHAIPYEPLRDEIHYLDQHQRPGDIVLVSFPSSYGFAFYERSIRFSVVGVSDPAIGFPDFRVTFPHDPIVVARGREESDVRAAFDEATRLMQQRHAARMWIVLSHTVPKEQDAWRKALANARIEFRLRRSRNFEGLALLRMDSRRAATD